MNGEGGGERKRRWVLARGAEEVVSGDRVDG